MDSSTFEKYLHYRLPEEPELRVVSVEKAFPGMSRETWLVNTTLERNDSFTERGFIFRMDPPGGSIVQIPLQFEFMVYRKLQGSQVPVPKTLWYEDDSEWLMDGREFFVREKVEGKVLVPEFEDPDPKHDSVRITMAKELAEKLALLHTCDWQALGFGDIMPVPKSLKDCARLDLDVWEEYLGRILPEPSPIIERAMIWLKENQPEEAPAISLLKGNNGIGEEIWQGTQIVAMCDWELSHIGDPSEDFSWCQGFRDRPDLMEILMEHYTKISGIQPSLKNIEYYSIFYLLKTFASLQTGIRIYTSGKDFRIQLANMGLWSHQVVVLLAEKIGL